MCKGTTVLYTPFNGYGALNYQRLFILFQVMDIALIPDPFTVELDLLTPTFKNKRPQLRKYFADQITALYADNAQKAS